MLICMSCARPIVFGPQGWAHREPGTCTSLSVAWPPPVTGDEANDDEDAA